MLHDHLTETNMDERILQKPLDAVPQPVARILLRL